MMELLFLLVVIFIVLIVVLFFSQQTSKIKFKDDVKQRVYDIGTGFQIGKDTFVPLRTN